MSMGGETFDLCLLEGCSARDGVNKNMEDVERIGIYAADVGRGRKKGGGLRAGESLVLIMPGGGDARLGDDGR
jgi:hypothetical protein